MTAAKFLAVLKGDGATAGGPVLASNENSTVFIFYSGPASQKGQADMPTGPALTEAELMDAINYMNDNKMYKQLVIYWSSDYSGSMFANLPDNTKVFAVSSASADETQQKSYCPPDDDVVYGYKIGACLATQFGTTWLQNSTTSDCTALSIAAQYEKVKDVVKGSTVTLFGDQSFANMPVGAFQGLIDYTEPANAPLDFVYWYRNRFPIAGQFS